MKVIEYEPQFWFFLTDGKEYYIDVNCSYSFVGFGRLIRLSEMETNEYRKRGKEYLNLLANDIQYYALSKYKERNIVGENDKQIQNAIAEFNKEKNFR